MYAEITNNKRRSVILIVLFILIIAGIGWFLGTVTQTGSMAVVYALVLSLVMTLFSYYSGDRVALWTAGATPLTKTENPYLYRIVENLCIADGLPVPAIHLIRDTTINAFATGRDPSHASLAVTEGALSKLENEELEGVIAHELSHIKNYDIRVMTIVIVLVGAISLLAHFFMRGALIGNRNRDERGAPPALIIVGIALTILSPLIAQLIQLAVSRRREYLADASGALLTRYPEGLARALEKIGNENSSLRTANTATAHLYFTNPFGAQTKKSLANLFSTHPPLEQRIQLLRGMGH